MSDFTENPDFSNKENITPPNITPETEILPDNIEPAESITPPTDNISQKEPASEGASTVQSDCADNASCPACDSSEDTAGENTSECNNCTDDSCKYTAEDSQTSNACETENVQPVPIVKTFGSSDNHSETAAHSPAKQLTPAAICALCICTTLIFNIIAFALAFTFFIKPSASKNQNYLVPAQNGTGNSQITSIISADPSAPFNASAIYANNVNSVVGISTDETIYNIFGQASTYASTGTGFIISEDGYILTNYHVVQSSGTITVTLYNGSSYTATLVGYESSNDVAVLKINETGLQPVTVGDYSTVVVGDNVCVIGNPLGELTYTLTQGGVSALQREINVDGQPISMFQFDAAVSPGNSGGPVFDSKGTVIGIVTAKSIQSGVEGIGFAIPISDVKDIVNDIIANGYVTGKAYFGIGVSTSGNPKGAYVISVNSGSCAENAGIQVGDIITEIDGKQVTSASELISAKKDYRAGDTVTLKGYRNGEGIVFTVTFDEETPERVSQNDRQTQQAEQYYYDRTNPYYYFYR